MHQLAIRETSYLQTTDAPFLNKDSERSTERAIHLQQTGTLRTDHHWDNPVRYCRVSRKYGGLGIKLWPKQEEVLQKMMQPPHKVLVRAGHNVGKTFLAACIASWFYDSFDPGKCIATAPTKDSVRDLLFAELRKLRRGDPKLLPADTRLFDHAQHWIHGYTANKDAAA